MECCNCFTDFLVKCTDQINIFAQLEPSTPYKWRITDKFSNIYDGDMTTDTDGFWNIPVADLPAGFLTPYSGDFKLEVLSPTFMPVSFKIAQEYDCINFSIKGGTAIKANIGLEFSCVEGALNPIVVE